MRTHALPFLLLPLLASGPAGGLPGAPVPAAAAVGPAAVPDAGQEPATVREQPRDPEVADAGAQGPLARGDAAYARHNPGPVPPPAAPIDEAIAAYREALAADPGDPETCWKLMRALYFKGQHVAGDEDERLELFAQAREAAEAALARFDEETGGPSLEDLSPGELAAALAGEPQAGPVYFWSAVSWGKWGENVGSFAAARRGVAGKVRDLAQALIALDESYENAGGHRILGRLHAVAPKVPFFTGWVDRELAVEHLRRAVEIAPDDPYNLLFLAEALLEHRPGARSEALELLQRAVDQEPPDGRALEGANAREQARILLDQVR